MSEMILTQYNGKILGPIAKVLGWIMDGIYSVLENLFHIENIGLCIIILTIIIYACLYPLTYKQQKFSKLSQKMNPELQAIQKKYKGKTDQVSMQKMQDETKMVYEKYGVSPSGSCIQMLIQMPILFALYRVFLNIPAYVPAVKDKFSALVTELMSVEGFATKMTSFMESAKISGAAVDFTVKNKDILSNYTIDVLYKMNSSGWDKLRDTFGNLAHIDATEKSLEKLNFFLGLNISDSPLKIIQTSFAAGAYLLLIGALLIPILSFITQKINIKLMPTSTPSENGDAMANQMKTMNTIMPLFSLVMCFTVPVGLGIYWIASAAIRCVQQFFINKHLDKMDWDEVMKANQEKAKAKREKKMGIMENQIANAAKLSTKANTNLSKDDKVNKEELLEKASEYRNNAKAGSMAAKANMVRDFNERNNK